VEIPLGRRIFRASLKIEGNRQVPFITQEDLVDGRDLVAQGIPREDAKISITNGHVEVPLGNPGLFNEAGECRFTTYAIRDTLSNYGSPVGQFLVSGKGVKVETSTYFLDCDALIQWIQDEALTTDPPWRTILPCPLQGALALLIQMRERAIQELPKPVGLDILPDRLRGWIGSVSASAAILDRTVFLERPNMSEREFLDSLKGSLPEQAAALSWFCRAREFSQGHQSGTSSGSAALLEEQRQLKWSPPFRRWQILFYDLLLHLKTDVEAMPLVEGWRKDVERGYQVKYRSFVANQTNGRELTQAWIRYRSGNFAGAVNAAHPLVTIAISPIADLAAILLSISLMRMAHFGSQPPAQLNSTNTRLAAVHRDLVQILEFCGPAHTIDVPKAPDLTSFLPLLPLTDLDRKVLSLFCTSWDTQLLESESDWLSSYFRFLIAIHLGCADNVKVLATALRARFAQIPASPDRPAIIDLVEKYA
jgi:hypothetical protein